MISAVIDIGTNTLLLLIAKDKGKKIEVLHEDHAITRLGQGLADNHFLMPQPIDRTMEALGKFLKTCEKFKVKKIVAVGTAACRNAANAEVFLNKAKEELGLKIQVITAQQEAEYTFLATYEDFKSLKQPLIVTDIGGGSTEIITGPKSLKRNTPQTVMSLSIGSVKLTEEHVHDDPINLTQFRRLHQAIRHSLEDELDDFYPDDFNPAESVMVSTAGTATTLCAIDMEMKRYNPEKIQGATLKKSNLEELIDRMLRMNVKQRQLLPGMEPLRADVILAGAMLLNELMAYFKQEETLISGQGLRYGVFYKKCIK